ncbi:MAG: hypothetical protein ACXAC2_22995 [Candidatus Kariarchaeaceae archaeon]|jgi:DNA-binding transcriptional ArsR family regulator
MVNYRQKLFDYWKNIPSFEFINITTDKYVSHPIRGKIIKLMREGVEEISPDGKFKVRHALNVTEISEQLRNHSMSKTTLYFHLDTLSEIGLIKTVAILHEGPHGRNKTKYFGRVARNLFLTSTKETCDNYISQFDEFQKMAKILEIKLPNNYSEIPERFNNTNERIYRVLGKWLIDHEEVIAEKKLDTSLLFEFLKKIYSIHPEFNEMLDETFKILLHEIQEK